MIYVCIARKFFHLQLEGLCTNMSSQTRKHMGGVLKKVASFTPSKTSRQVLLATKKYEFFCLLAPVPSIPKKRANQMNVACFSSDFLQQHMSTCLRLCVCACCPSVHSATYSPVCLFNPFKHLFNAAF